MGVSFFPKPNKGKDTSLIFAAVNYKGVKRFTIVMPFTSIKLKDWDKGAGWIKTGRGYQNNSHIENELLRFKLNMDGFYKEFCRLNKRYPTLDDVKNYIKMDVDHNDYFQDQREKRVFSLIPLFKVITKHRLEGKELYRGKAYDYETIENYNVAIRKLEAYGKYVSSKVTNLDVLNESFVRGFENYLLKVENQKINSCGCKLKIFRTLLNKLVKGGVLPFNPFNKFGIEIISEPSNSIALDEQELKEMQELDLSENLKIDRIRDQFLLMCWSGVRISDLNAFCDIPKDGDIVRIFNKKTSKEAIIPLFPEAKKIFEKYNHKVPRISGQKLNAGLKVLGEMIPGLNRNEQIQYNRGGKIIKETIPRYKLLCNHCGRRTLINTLINLGFEDRDIMVISGHTTMKSYEVYIKKKKGAAVKNILQQFNKIMELKSAANPLMSVKETI